MAEDGVDMAAEDQSNMDDADVDDDDDDEAEDSDDAVAGVIGENT